MKFFKIKQLGIEERLTAYREWLPDFQYDNYDKNQTTLYAFCDRLDLPCPSGVEYDDVTFRIDLTEVIAYMDKQGRSAMEGVALTHFLTERFSEGILGNLLTGHRLDMSILAGIKEAILHCCCGIIYKKVVLECITTFMRCCCEDYRQARSFGTFQRIAQINKWEFMADGRRVP